MCIICNTSGNEERAFEYIAAFEQAQAAMKAATEAMLKCSQVAITPEARKQYDATHKQMVRLVREWNKTEHQREQHS